MSCVSLGLDTERLVIVNNDVVADRHVLDICVGRDGANGDTVATAAGVALEDDVAAFVEGEAVVLVVDSAIFDS